MVLKVELCNDDDMPRVFEIFCEAFDIKHPMIEAMYPNHDTPAGRVIGAKRMLEIKKKDSHTTFLKVVDTDTGVMIAKAKWNIWKGVIPPEVDLDGDYWENEEEKEWAQHMNREFLISRRQALRDSEGHLVSLDILAVDPNYQRQGAGRLLVKWGTAIADELGYVAGLTRRRSDSHDSSSGSFVPAGLLSDFIDRSSRLTISARDVESDGTQDPPPLPLRLDS
ncbi:hypothetical protein NHQ30_001828 [Ciborinia camelliae]|nr:hypothetical protein NHQ30_001828 [Ciborinia camelliae]